MNLRLNRRWRDNIAGYSFIAINLAWVLIFTFYPVCRSFILSFQEWNPIEGSKFIGLDNYKEILQDWVFGIAFKNALYYALLTIPAGLVLAIVLAIALHRIKGRTLFRTLYFSPSICSSVAIAIIWTWLYNSQYGLINDLLGHVGIKGPGWLIDPRWAMPAVSITVVWAGCGYWMVMFLAGLQDIPEVYYDAAKVDGATSLQVFRFITLPMLTPTIFFYLTMAFITVWYQFDLVYVMTGGGPVNSTIMPALVIYEAAFRDFRMGYAAAVAWVMFAITFIITFLHFKISGRWTFYGR